MQKEFYAKMGLTQSFKKRKDVKDVKITLRAYVLTYASLPETLSLSKDLQYKSATPMKLNKVTLPGKNKNPLHKKRANY